MPASGVDRYAEALEAAARSTQPDHVAATFRRVTPNDTASCGVLVRAAVGNKVLPQGRRIQMRVSKPGQPPLLTVLVGPLPVTQMQEDDLIFVWKQAWPLVAPPAPPSPKPSAPPKRPPPAPLPPLVDPESPESYVDPDLAEAREELERELQKPDRPAVFSLVFNAGLLSRSLDAEGGRPQDESALLSLGGRAALHIGGILGWSKDRLDIEGAYWRQLVDADIDGQAFGAESDRVRAVVFHHRPWFGDRGPRLGPLAGYEFRRFNFDPAATTLSIQYSVLRLGAVAEQPILRFGKRGGLGVFARGAGRVPFGSNQGDFDIGFDVQGGLGFEHDSGFLAHAGVGYTSQAGTSETGDGTIDFNDGFIDVIGGVGWSL
ncbi:MAG: hypothetical protein ACFB9M_14255 [Myxococcota bacterium]